ncbi:MAG: ABC transporter ATP-binding protein [Ruminococcaceae bacterium]|nr:ABC transporter ATP-binding protein [Oscillospiraceae bacterium]
MEELAIKIEHVSKQYRLGAIGGGTLQGDLQTWWARVRGKEDPNSKIGSDTTLKIGERFLALDDISFEVKKGEAVGIIGHNGAGKSTLLKLLSRVTAPTSGTISYNGRIASMLEVGTGFHPELTGRENVYMNGAILGMTKAEIDAKFDQIVEFAEMEKFIDTPVKRYSSGMYVKLAFSVAAHLDSEIMVMDEVLAVGDMKFQQKCLGRMGDAANSEGRTVLYVSHNMNTIRQLCKRCIVMDHGRIIFDGDTETAINIYVSSTKAPRIVNDCSRIKRNKAIIDGNVSIQTITFRNTDKPFYSGGGPVQVNVCYTAKRHIPNMAMRMTVEAGDKTVVGLATSKACISTIEGENEINLSLSIDWLAPGKYIIKLTAYSVNEFGTNLMHDVVENACAFEKRQDNDANNKMGWNHTWWGFMMFPELEVK